MRKEEEESTSYYLYLYPNESPTKPLVLWVFDSNNYHSWSISMLTSLSAKNKVEYVDGTAFQLAKTDSTFSAWNQCDSMVVSWLSRCFHLYSSKYHLDGQTPQKNWNDLRTR